jgi:hypothetical protein
MVAFEDLVTDPEPCLRKLCLDLDIPFEERMLAQTASAVMPVHYRQAGFRPEKAAVPDLPARIVDYMAEDLTYCGYA